MVKMGGRDDQLRVLLRREGASALDRKHRRVRAVGPDYYRPIATHAVSSAVVATKNTNSDWVAAAELSASDPTRAVEAATAAGANASAVVEHPRMRFFRR
jgi:hypothetical protein